MTEKSQPKLPAEEIERLKELEKQQLISSLVNIRELARQIYEDGLEWLEILTVTGNGSFSEELGVVDLRLAQLRAKYPKPSQDPQSEFQKSSTEVKKQSLLIHDTVLPQLGRLYELAGEKIFSQAYQLINMLPQHPVTLRQGGGNNGE